MQPTITDERMYEAGLLRIVTKMRIHRSQRFEHYFDEVQSELRLDPAGFRQYVNANFQKVVAASATRMR